MSKFEWYLTATKLTEAQMILWITVLISSRSWLSIAYFKEDSNIFCYSHLCDISLLSARTFPKNVQIFPWNKIISEHFRKCTSFRDSISGVCWPPKKITQKSDGIKGWNNYFRPFLFGLSKNIGGIYRPSYPTHLLWSIIARRLFIATIPRCLIFMPQRPLVIIRQTPEQWRHPPGYQRVKLRDWLLGL